MIVCVIGAITGPSPDIVERWPPAKTLAYFESAIEVRRMLGGQAAKP